jgi:hypothetical protein
MNIFAFFIFILIAAFFLAMLEIQIEGKFGWAKNLPTWRKTISLGFTKFEVTGYHIYLFAFVFFLMHFRFVFQPFTLKDELFTMSAYVFMVIFEDFFWFMFNPNYGLKKYNKENVYWFKNWFLGFPSFYFQVLPIAIILFVVASWV